MKKNDKQLSWVAGTDVNLCVWLYELVRNGNETAKQPFDFTVCERIDTVLSSFFGVKIPVAHAVSAQDANGLVLSIPHTVAAGMYSIEIKVVQDGVHLRSFEGGAINITNENAEANTSFEVISYQRRTEYEIDLQFVPSAQVRPLNSYEIWKQSHPNGTFAQFMLEYTEGIIINAMGELLDLKQDKEAGKGLSTNDFTAGHKNALDVLIEGMIQGKGLSSNDFTQYYKGSITSLMGATSELERTKLSYAFVDSLPPISSTNMRNLYLVRLESGYFDGYIYDQNATPSARYVKIIEHIDLSSYSTTAQMNAAIQAALTNYYTKQEVDEMLQNVDIDVDSALSGSSENPVQNKVVKAALDGKADQNNTYTKNEVYTKEEANNLFANAGNPIVIVDPAEWPLESGEDRTTYRVPGDNSYTDYGWNGTQFVQLAEYTTAFSGDVWY